MAITPGGRVGDASPLGKPGSKRKLSDYEREVARAIMRKGRSRRDAIRIARGVIDRAAATGRWGKGRAKPNVRAGAAASVAQRKALVDHAHGLSAGVIDLAARDGHHIPGTSYHWHHGWRPRDVFTAAKYHKRTASKKFFNVEPEEFNGKGETPKFIGEAQGNGPVSLPEMKYHANKLLAGSKHGVNGKTITVSKVSESKTHVLGTDGKKYAISDLKPKTSSDAAALSSFKKQKFKTAIKQYQIKSKFGQPKSKPHTIPKHDQVVHESTPTWSKTPVGHTYNADPKSFDEPVFPHSKSLSSPNAEPKFTTREMKALRSYTGNGYSSVNTALRTKTHLDTHKEDITQLDSAIGKATPLEGNPILHRGVGVAAIHNLEPGESFVESGYSSTSRNPTLGLAARSTRLHIESFDPKLKRLDVDAISSHTGEREVILPRNTRYTVLRKVNHGSHSHLYVHAEPA